MVNRRHNSQTRRSTTRSSSNNSSSNRTNPLLPSAPRSTSCSGRLRAGPLGVLDCKIDCTIECTVRCDVGTIAGNSDLQTYGHFVTFSSSDVLGLNEDSLLHKSATNRRPNDATALDQTTDVLQAAQRPVRRAHRELPQVHLEHRTGARTARCTCASSATTSL